MASVSSGLMNYQHLFMLWRTLEGNHKDKSAVLVEELLKWYSIDNVSEVEGYGHVQKDVYEVCKKFNTMWKKFHYNEERALRMKSDFLNKPFPVPKSFLNKPLVSSGKKGRRQVLFSKSTDSVKRRKTAELRASHSAAELAFASSMKLREEGKREQASVVELATQTTPHRATTIMSSLKAASRTCVPYSPNEALALILDNDDTKAQYNRMRLGAKKRFADIYPSYKRVLEAKKKCYPDSAATCISETEMEITLQALLDHTSERIVLSKADTLKNYSDEELQNVVLFVKYGCDGTGDLSQFNQAFNVDDDGSKSDANIFVTSIVPISATTNGKILFQNSRPSSVRYCRPLRLQYKKESTELILAEKENIDRQLQILQPSTVECMGRKIIIRYELKMTMVDVKVVNALTSTSSAQRCYICGATPILMNNIDEVVKRKTRDETFEYGLSTLHAYIRFFEYFIHISYRLDIQKWQARTTAEKESVAMKKKQIQQKFRRDLGLRVDEPRTGGSGNSNCGNSSRCFFNNWQLSAEITGIKADLLYRCKTILEALSSGIEVQCDRFEQYGIETARMLVHEYPWFRMPATVHKVLIHGAKVISSFILPIGQLSEEAQEAKNKDVKRFRAVHSRKYRREATNTDLLHRLLESSDPLISSIRHHEPKDKQKYSVDTKRLLFIHDDSDEENDDEDD